MTGSSKSSKPKVWLMIFAAVVLPAPMLPARATKRLERGRRGRRTVFGAGAWGGSGASRGGGVGGAAFGARLRWGERDMRGLGLARLRGGVQDLAQQVRPVGHDAAHAP